MTADLVTHPPVAPAAALLATARLLAAAAVLVGFGLLLLGVDPVGQVVGVVLVVLGLAVTVAAECGRLLRRRAATT